MGTDMAILCPDNLGHSECEFIDLHSSLEF